MAYESFRAELEEKADKIGFIHVEGIQEIGDKLLIEFGGDHVPGKAFYADYGYQHAGTLTEEQAAEADAAEGNRIVVYER